MHKRILAIGDIHGEYDKLLDLYGKIEFNPPDDLLVFLGDYVDRGPEPLAVLDWMMEHEGDPNVVMLRGNHDQMMLDYYVRKEVQKRLGFHVPEDDYGEDWLYNGGDATARCLDERAGAAAPGTFADYKRRCLDFLGNLPLTHTVEVGGKTFFFCHAGVKPGVPPAEQDPEDLLWIRFEFHRNYRGEAVVVAGHTPVQKIGRFTPGMEPVAAPIIRDNMILVDTWAWKGFPLSCVDVLSGRVWQSYRTK